MGIFDTDQVEFILLQDATYYVYKLVPGSQRINRKAGTLLFRLASVEDSSDSFEMIITERGGRYSIRDDFWEEFDVETYFTEAGGILYADDEECRVLYRVSWPTR